MKKHAFEYFCKMLYSKIHNKEFAGESKMREQDFSRNRKFSFGDTVSVVLNKTGRGVRSAINAYRESVRKDEMTYSQQAFSKGRQRIKWEAFRELHQFSVEEFYKEHDVKTYRGYRVSAIDGTRLNLPYHPDTLTEFGVQKSSGSQPQALGSCLCDVLNGVVMDALLDRHDANERILAESHIEYLSKIKTDKEILLFDRGYPSARLIEMLNTHGFRFVMRTSPDFLRNILKKVAGNDCVVMHKFVQAKQELPIRVLHVTIPNTETQEYLVTNLFDASFTSEDFCFLYHLRWGIETKYNDLKNKLKIEQFTGTTPLAIRQDYYATMLLLNMAAMLVAENEDTVNALHNSAENKYLYKENINYTIELLKKDVINLLIYAGHSKGRKLFKHIQRELSLAVVPIRNDRSFSRSRSHPGNKFPQNMKP